MACRRPPPITHTARYARCLPKSRLKFTQDSSTNNTVWACSVCAVNAQNAGMLVPYVAAEANIDVSSQEKLRPFVIITFVQAFLDLSAFLLTCGREIPKLKED